MMQAVAGALSGFLGIGSYTNFLLRHRPQAVAVSGRERCLAAMIIYLFLWMFSAAMHVPHLRDCFCRVGYEGFEVIGYW